MIIDTHIHGTKYSCDSSIMLDEIIDTAKNRGLDGICITNHENNDLRNDIGDSKIIDDILVIVGAEILTNQGDILVFGVRDLPKQKIDAKDLLEIVEKNKGVAIPAHPFRTNNRGLGTYIEEVAHLIDGVESFNGSTTTHHNLHAYALAAELKLASFGASDAHVLKQIGVYATKFYQDIKNQDDFIKAIKSRNFHPVMWIDGKYENLSYNYAKNRVVNL